MTDPARTDAAWAAPPIPVAVVLLLAGLAVVKQFQVGLGPGGFLSTGLLTDPDSWARAQRVLDLWQGAGWFEERVFRLNAPSGVSLHWTRPLDVLILLPASVLNGVFGFAPRDAVLLAGAWICPALHAACAVAAAHAARALWTGIGPLVAGLLVIANPVVGGYSGIGRADHHTLILLPALLALGAAARAAARPGDRAAAWRAGAFAGMGVWVSPEALLVAAPVLAAFGALWVAEGARGVPGSAGAAAQGLRASLGFSLVVAAAIVVEHPPSAWLDGEYDKVSAQHLLMGALAAAVFAAATRTDGGAARRAAVGGAAAASAMAALLFFRPDALSASFAELDAGAAAMTHATDEMRPVATSLAGLLNDAPTLLAAAPAALLALALGVPSWRREGRLAVVAPLGFALVATLAAALLHRRFALDFAAPACLLAAGLPGLALCGLRRPALRAPAAFLAMAAVFGTPFLSVLGSASAEGTAAPAGSGECGAAALKAAAGHGAAEAARGAADPVLFASSVDAGPELAWRTPFRAVGAPYHRGGRAVSDTAAFFGAADDVAARAIADRRHASLVLVCAPSPGEPGGDALVARLRRGEGPGWLEAAPLPGAPAGVLLFSVRPRQEALPAPGG